MTPSRPHRFSNFRLALIAATFAFLPGCATNDPITRTNAANTSASQLTRDSHTALASLYSQNAGARALGRQAKAIVVFPSITRAGFVFGGQAGNGTVFRGDGSVAGHFQTDFRLVGPAGGCAEIRLCAFSDG